MRKLFLALMLSSALGALAIGGALAWTGSSASNGSATGGQIAFSVYALTGTGSPVLDNGSWINVANGGIANTGNVTVHVTGGTTLPTCIGQLRRQWRTERHQWWRRRPRPAVRQPLRSLPQHARPGRRQHVPGRNPALHHHR
jgi:hypothetical protein